MSRPIKDGPVLFYCKDGVLYPTVMTEEQQYVFNMTIGLLSPLTVVMDKPQGAAVDLLKGDSKDA